MTTRISRLSNEAAISGMVRWPWAQQRRVAAGWRGEFAAPAGRGGYFVGAGGCPAWDGAGPAILSRIEVSAWMFFMRK